MKNTAATVIFKIRRIFIMKKITALLLSLALSFGMCSLFTSCGCSQDDEVSVFYYTYSDTYISSVRSEMDKFLKESGVNFNNYDANSNQATQTEQVDTAITKGSRLLIVNIVDTGSDDAAKTIIGKAKAANIPVIFFNRAISDSVLASYDKCAYVGTDSLEAGKLQGQMIGEYVKANFSSLDINKDGKISYVLFKGQQGNAEAEARTKYAVEDANKILTAAGLAKLSFYDKANTQGYLVDQDGNWSNAAANNYMKTILSGYSEAGKNMVELVIANNDEMALGALAALEEAGYNKQGKRYIPVFGVDATEAAKSKINSGAMTGTVKQDSEGMARTIVKIASNLLADRDKFEGIDESMLAGGGVVNIPYSAYNKEN